MDHIDYKEDFIPYVQDRTIVPVISNSFRLEEIFRADEELCAAMSKSTPKFFDEVRAIDQQLTKTWADETVKYPMSDGHNLARVAQYFQVIKKESIKANKSYLSFINERLLKMIGNQPNKQDYDEILRQYQNAIEPWTFTKLVKELDLPSFSGEIDPLKALAKLPLPMYITTSYFRFIEEALKSEGRRPSTQYWSWIGEKLKLEYLPDPDPDPSAQPEQMPANPSDYVRDYKPDPMRPVVYHLFGIENLAKTLILSEDDYINFLMTAAESKKSPDIIPSPLLEALSEKRLLLLGYHLQDWDFRALFRFISNFKNRAPGVSQNIAIQLMPDLENKDFNDKLLDYLEHYFEDYKFEVKWIHTETFIRQLVATYEGKRPSGGDS